MPSTMLPTIIGQIRGCRITHQGPISTETSSSQGGTQRNGDHSHGGRNDPSGFWWPLIYPTWIPTTVFFSFSVSLIVAQFTIFSSFSGPELPEPFWGPKRRFFGNMGETLAQELMFHFPMLYSSDRSFQRAIVHVKWSLYAKVTTPGSWCTNFRKRGPTVWHFISKG